jgi:hypothetical protein
LTAVRRQETIAFMWPIKSFLQQPSDHPAPRRAFFQQAFLGGVLGLWLALDGCNSAPAAPTAWLDNWRDQNTNWRGVHLWLDNESAARSLVKTLPQLATTGVNVVVVEVNYSFEFQAHPELRNRRFVTRATAHELAETAHRHGIRLIPEFNCLGHQSFGKQIGPLLRLHPEFNETPAQSLTDKNIYCLEWRPDAPGLNDLIFSLIDEMADAFEADAFHVGMDEVYLLGSGTNASGSRPAPAELYAGQVRALHDHIVGRRHMEMLMWADRIIGPKFQGHSRYDNDLNDLSAAIDLIPKDIIQCDWHYEWKKSYPSVPYLISKGFRVWPSGFEPLAASRAFSDYAHGLKSDRVIGYLATTWNKTSIADAPNWPPIREILPAWKQPTQ